MITLSVMLGNAGIYRYRVIPIPRTNALRRHYFTKVLVVVLPESSFAAIQVSSLVFDLHVDVVTENSVGCGDRLKIDYELPSNK